MPAKKKKPREEAVDDYASEAQLAAVDHKLELLGVQIEELRNDRDTIYQGELAAAFERIEELEERVAKLEQPKTATPGPVLLDPKS